mmetsp:Transcript_10100/g.21070  ORF Transcript_10100/g.21070 Transcript_10100/m.21070 type:complete len:344 (-) Transcript_10100:1614-2645(-)
MRSRDCDTAFSDSSRANTFTSATPSEHCSAVPAARSTLASRRRKASSNCLSMERQLSTSATMPCRASARFSHAMESCSSCRCRSASAERRASIFAEDSYARRSKSSCNSLVRCSDISLNCSCDFSASRAAAFTSATPSEQWDAVEDSDSTRASMRRRLSSSCLLADRQLSTSARKPCRPSANSLQLRLSCSSKVARSLSAIFSTSTSEEVSRHRSKSSSALCSLRDSCASASLWALASLPAFTAISSRSLSSCSFVSPVRCSSRARLCTTTFSTACRAKALASETPSEHWLATAATRSTLPSTRRMASSNCLSTDWHFSNSPVSPFLVSVRSMWLRQRRSSCC